MNYLPLYLVYNPPHDTLAEKLSLCGSMLLRGMGTVFLVLIVLWGIIELFSYVSTSGERSAKKKEEKKEEKKELPLALQEPEPQKDDDFGDFDDSDESDSASSSSEESES